MRKQIESALAGRIPAALSPRLYSAPELLPCGLAEVDAMLGGGLPLGAITELTGPHSSGRTTLALATLAELTQQGHSYAYVDVADALEPLSAAALGVDLRRLLWIRSNWIRLKTSRPKAARPNASSDSALRLNPALRATDLLLNAGGFRALVLDLGDLPPEQARRIWQPGIASVITRRPFHRTQSVFRLERFLQNLFAPRHPESSTHWLTFDERPCSCP